MRTRLSGPDTVSSPKVLRRHSIASAHPQGHPPGKARLPATRALKQGKPRRGRGFRGETPLALRLLSVLDNHWRLQVTRRGLAPLSALLSETAGTADDLDDWLDREDIPDGVPYLISPDLEYDIDLNRYFLRQALRERPGTRNWPPRETSAGSWTSCGAPATAWAGGMRRRRTMTPTGTGGARIPRARGWRGQPGTGSCRCSTGSTPGRPGAAW